MDYLSNSDYQSILNFYKIPFDNKSKESIKQKAESILASKLCKCIKKVDKNGTKKNESKAIAICKNAIINKKGLDIFRFTCKTKPTLISSKKNTNIKIIKKRFKGKKRFSRKNKFKL